MNYFIENTLSTMIYYEDKKAGTKYELYKIFFFHTVLILLSETKKHPMRILVSKTV